MNSPPSSNAFALPIAVSVLPAPRIDAVIVALHCLPLPLLLAAGGMWLAAAATAAMASLALALHRQRRAAGAARLITTAGNEWRLYRRADGDGVHPRGDGDGDGVPPRGDGDGVPPRGDGDGDGVCPRGDGDGHRDIHGNPGETIDLIDGARFGRFTVLLVAQRGRRFHLAVDDSAQAHEQTHRLRVWLANRHGAGDSKGILLRRPGR